MYDVETDLPIGKSDLALDVNGRTLLQHCRITFWALEVGPPIERPVWEKTCEVSTRRCDASLWLAQYTHARAQLRAVVPRHNIFVDSRASVRRRDDRINLHLLILEQRDLQLRLLHVPSLGLIHRDHRRALVPRHCLLTAIDKSLQPQVVLQMERTTVAK